MLGILVSFVGLVIAYFVETRIVYSYYMRDENLSKLSTSIAVPLVRSLFSGLVAAVYLGVYGFCADFGIVAVLIFVAMLISSISYVNLQQEAQDMEFADILGDVVSAIKYGEDEDGDSDSEKEIRKENICKTKERINSLFK